MEMNPKPQISTAVMGHAEASPKHVSWRLTALLERRTVNTALLLRVPVSERMGS